MGPVNLWRLKLEVVFPWWFAYLKLIRVALMANFGVEEGSNQQGKVSFLPSSAGMVGNLLDASAQCVLWFDGNFVGRD